MLTLTNSANSDLTFDIPNSNYTVNETIFVKLWVKLGTATDFCITVHDNVWSNRTHEYFKDVLNTQTYTQITFSFLAQNKPYMVLCVGSNNWYNVYTQTPGTVYVYGWEFFTKEGSISIESPIFTKNTWN